MRILLATDGNLERQGICTFMLQWIKGLRSLSDVDCEVVVYFRKTIKDRNMKEAYSTLGAEIYSGGIPDDGTMKNPRFRHKVKNDIRNLLSKQKIDVVHINSSAKGFTFAILREAVRAGVPVRISHTHGKNLDGAFKRAYLLPIQMYILRRATILAGCSADAGLYMFGKAAVNSNKWKFIPNTIDAENFSFNKSARVKCRQELNLSENELLIGAVGYLEEIKNHGFLLEVMQELQQAGVKATLLFFGEGSLLPQLKHKAASLGLSKQVIFYGVTNDIPSWLSAMDCYVMPSLTEGLPISAVEAQANGLPCLLSDRVPPEVDLCSDVYHLPIDKGPELWAQKILSLPEKTAEERKRGAEAVCKAGFGKESMPGYIRSLYGIR